MSVALQPLRVPNGWRIAWNTLHEEEPTESANAGGYYFGTTNLYLANHPARGRAVDVEWRIDDQRPAGCYRLRVLRLISVEPAAARRRQREDDFNADWQDPLHTFETVSRPELVAELEAWLAGDK
ncbi:MAG: hypothetical protein U0804_13670 [Gemmataceae bacterium]